MFSILKSLTSLCWYYISDLSNYVTAILPSQEYLDPFKTLQEYSPHPIYGTSLMLSFMWSFKLYQGHVANKIILSEMLGSFQNSIWIFSTSISQMSLMLTLLQPLWPFKLDQGQLTDCLCSCCHQYVIITYQCYTSLYPQKIKFVVLNINLDFIFFCLKMCILVVIYVNLPVLLF